MLPPNFAQEPSRLLLPSVIGATGPPSVLVEADRVNEGIIEVLRLFTLADLAKEALVGVLTALGSPASGIFVVEVSVLCWSKLESCETGLTTEVSSFTARLARLLGAVFSSRSLFPL